MITLYSHNGAWPTHLPNRIILSDGRSRTDNTTFTPEELADAGWVAVSDPPVVEWPNKLDWDGTDWVVRAPNENEIAERWSNIRKSRDQQLAASDIHIIKAYELGIPPDPAWVTYRQQLRDIPQNTIDPFFVSWPANPGEA